jgi:hypothetical protein
MVKKILVLVFSVVMPFRSVGTDLLRSPALTYSECIWYSQAVQLKQHYKSKVKLSSVPLYIP